jgi:hypothetical protein
VTFDDFLPEVLPYVEGCPDAVAVNHIIKAARTFCARTLVWNYDTEEPTLTVIGQTVYPIDLDSDQERVKILSAWLDDAEIEVLDQSSGRRSQRRGACSSFIYAPNAIDLVLQPAPTADDQRIDLQLAVKPSLTATEWPDDLAEHVTDIAHGAISSLCMLPRVSWTNLVLAATERAMFKDRIGTVGFNVSRGFSLYKPRARVTFF